MNRFSKSVVRSSESCSFTPNEIHTTHGLIWTTTAIDDITLHPFHSFKGIMNQTIRKAHCTISRLTMNTLNQNIPIWCDCKVLFDTFYDSRNVSHKIRSWYILHRNTLILKSFLEANKPYTLCVCVQETANRTTHVVTWGKPHHVTSHLNGSMITYPFGTRM